VEQFVGRSGTLRAGCGRNVGADWADSSLDREKWQAPLAGQEGAIAAERMGRHLSCGTSGRVWGQLVGRGELGRSGQVGAGVSVDLAGWVMF